MGCGSGSTPRLRPMIGQTASEATKTMIKALMLAGSLGIADGTLHIALFKLHVLDQVPDVVPGGCGAKILAGPAFDAVQEIELAVVGVLHFLTRDRRHLVRRHRLDQVG